MRSKAMQAELDRELDRQCNRLLAVKLNYNPRAELSPGAWLALDIIRHDARRAYCAALPQRSKSVVIDDVS